MKIMSIIIGLCFGLQIHAAKEKPIVGISKLKNTVLEKSLFFPISIHSKVNSKIKSDNQYIVLEKLVELGQKVKKGSPLLILRNQDMSVHYEKRIIKSPVAGVVASISVDKGQYINKGDGLILINDPSNLMGKIEVSAIDYKKLRTGLNGVIGFSSLDLKGIPVSISGIGTAVDNLTGTISVELKIKKQLDDLIPGVIGLAEITLNKEDRVLVKEKSLYYIGEDTFIATLNDKKVKKVKVSLGQRYKDKIEIVSGLELGEEYISESPKFLRDNEEVQIKKK